MRRLLVLALLPLWLGACSVQQQEISVPAATLPANGVTRLAMNINVGTVTVTPSNDGQVHATLSLKPSSSFFGLLTNSASQAAAQHAVISHVLNNGTLTLGVQYPANADTDNISEVWNVAVPPGTQINGQVNVGVLSITGISGGVQAELNVGKVRLDVPGGPLKITADVGSIDATVRSLDYSNVTLDSNVGKTSLTVDGVAAGNPQRTGAGENLSYTMNGKNAINLQVSTGSVKLVLLTH